MKPTICLTLISVLVGAPFTVLAQQTQAPGTLGGVVVQASGVISGAVASSSGRRLSNITMQLLSPAGVVIGRTMTTRNGEYKFQPVNFDTYTLQCVDDNKVIGTSSVMLTAPMQSVNMTCTSDAAGYWAKWGVLTALGAAALAAGATALVATGGDASGSR